MELFSLELFSLSFVELWTKLRALNDAQSFERGLELLGLELLSLVLFSLELFSLELFSLSFLEL